jgi:hypothetical protein
MVAISAICGQSHAQTHTFALSYLGCMSVTVSIKSVVHPACAPQDGANELWLLSALEEAGVLPTGARRKAGQ